MRRIGSTGFDAVEKIIDGKQIRDIDFGICVNVNVNGIRVRLAGSSNTQDAITVSGMQIQTGDQVVLVRPRTQNQWIAIGAVGTNEIGSLATNVPTRDNYELAVPNNIRVGPSIRGCCVLVWDSPPQQAIAFELQTNTVKISTGADNVLTTYGAYCIIESDTDLYMRVRSVSTDFRRSGWSEWTLVPATPLPATVIETVTYWGEVITYNGEVVTYTSE